MLRFEYHAASKLQSHTKRELRSFQVGKNLRIKIITIGGVEDFIVIDGILQNAHLPVASLLCDGEREKEGKQMAEGRKTITV
jgi:hypothetical protein